MTCPTNCSASTMGYNYLYSANWELRHRVGWSGIFGLHGYTSDTQYFNSRFHSRLGSVFWMIDRYASRNGLGNIQWIGNVGARVCKTGCHSSGNALDITALSLTNTFFDMNVSWRSGQALAQQRGYLAIWAGLSVYCKTVLTNAYNSAHRNHIHVDHDANNQIPPPIRTYATTDTKLIQIACNLLHNKNLVVDGQWGSLTIDAYNSMLSQLGLACTSPTTNYWHARALLILIMRHGFASRLAGYYTYSYC